MSTLVPAGATVPFLRKGARWVLPAVLAASLLVVLPQRASAANRLVPQQFPTIQAAVDASNPGDVILIKPGTYFETVEVTTNNLTIRKNPSFSGVVIVDAFNTLGEEGFDVDADGFVIRDLTVRHADGDAIDCVGLGCTVIQVRVDGDTTNDCVEITGDDLLVQSSTFVACQGRAVNVLGPDVTVPASDNARILNNQATLSDDDCIQLDTPTNALVEGNTLEMCEDGGGIDLFSATGAGTGNTVRNNTITSTDSHGVDVTGSGNTVQGNTITNIEDEGVFVEGDGNVILSNKVEGTAGNECYELIGNNVMVQFNRARFCDGGYFIYGGEDVDGNEFGAENPVVRNNRVEFAGDADGFRIWCGDRSGGVSPTDACSSGRVEQNFASGVNNDDDGFDILLDNGTGAGFQVLNNTAQQNIGNGFFLQIDSAIVMGNRAHLNGAENEEGFLISGDDNNVESNVATRSGGDGFRVHGSDNDLTLNRAVDSQFDGFHIATEDFDAIPSDDNDLDQNVALRSLADGIENDGMNTTVTNNTSSKSRANADCTNDGTISTNTGNSCADGSNFGVPGSGVGD
jgi:parallel beta-helix repeat protein